MSKSKSNELFWGVLLITLGVVFLLDKLDIMGSVIFSEYFGRLF